MSDSTTFVQQGAALATQKVALYYTCKTSEGWKRYLAAIGRNGKIRPHYAQVGNAQRLYPEGHYDLRHTENRKTIWTNVGEDAAVAQAQQIQSAKKFAVRAAADEAGIQVVEGPSRVNLAERAKAYHDRQ